MQSKKFLEWFEKQGLLRIAKNNFIHFRKVFRECLDATNEDILIICDNGYPDKRISPLMAVSYYYAAQKLGLNARLVAQAPKLKGENTSDEVIEALRVLKNESIIILSLSHRLGG
ncbi:MAG: hypothetical protein ABIJ08_05525, partial [Nanoarchaeota archaeon]